jgi:hypothetical protein
MKKLLLVALLSSVATLVVTFSVVGAELPKKVKLENAKVRVSEVTYLPGVARERYTRPTDQVIVFLDDSKYSRLDSTTKAKTVRERKSGDVIWHDKGEDAPVLVNLGSKPYRSLVIELLR